MTTTGQTGRQELQATLERYSWYHTIELLPGLSTPGIRSLAPLVEYLKGVVRALDVRGKRILDVGARDGALAFENDLSRGAVEVLIPYFQSSVQMQQMNLLDLTPDVHGRFDIVLCCGVLYHLRYPFWGLRALASVVEDGGM